MAEKCAVRGFVRRTQASARVASAVVLALTATACQSVSTRVPSWAWPPPIGVALLRGEVPGEGASRSGDPRVVYLVPTRRVAPLPSFQREVAVHWTDGTFQPGRVALRRDARLRIVNDGALAHRLFTAGPRPLRLDLAPHGERLASIGARGASHIYCSLHPSEYFFVYESDQRYVVAVAEDGSWSIGPVAPGDYQLMLWTPSEVGVVREVRIWPWTIQRQTLGPVKSGRR